MKNYQIVLTSLVSFFISYTVLFGIAQKYIHFQSELNEIGVFSISSTMGFVALFGLDWKSLYNWLKN